MATQTMTPTAKLTNDMNNKNRNISKFNLQNPQLLYRYSFLVTGKTRSSSLHGFY
jgi:hypothetical protein